MLDDDVVLDIIVEHDELHDHDKIDEQEHELDMLHDDEDEHFQHDVIHGALIDETDERDYIDIDDDEVDDEVEHAEDELTDELVYDEVQQIVDDDELEPHDIEQMLHHELHELL